MDSLPSQAKISSKCSTLKGVVQRKNCLTRCQNNVTGQDITRLCLRRDISVRQHYKVVIIPSVTSRHRPDMIRNVLKGTLNLILNKKNDIGNGYSYDVAVKI